MFWTVLVLLVILWVSGIACQTQDFTVDVSAPLEQAYDCSSAPSRLQVGKKLENPHHQVVRTTRMLG